MDDCVKFEGAVEKTSGFFKNKSKIWLVLDNRTLNFYKNKMKESCIDSIEIADVQIVRQTGNKGGEEFEISTVHKSYTFVAAVFELAEAWVKVIHKAMSIRSIPSIDDDKSHVPKSPSTPMSSPTSVFEEELGELSSQQHNSIFGVKLKPTRLSRSSVTSSPSPERIRVRHFSYEAPGFNENIDAPTKKTTEQDRKAKIVPPMQFKLQRPPPSAKIVHPMQFKLQRPPPSFKPPAPPISKSNNTNMNQKSQLPKENITIRPQSPAQRDDAIKQRKSQNEGDTIIVGLISPRPGDNVKAHSPRPTDDGSNSSAPNGNTTFIDQTSHEDNAHSATQEGHVLKALDTPSITDTSKRPVDKKIESVEDTSGSANMKGTNDDLHEADPFKRDSASRSKSSTWSLKKSKNVEDHHDRDMVDTISDVDISQVRMRKSQIISQNVECNDVDVNISHVVMRKSARSLSTMNTELDEDMEKELIDCSEVMKTGTKDTREAYNIESTNVNHEEDTSQVVLRKSSRSRSTSNDHQLFNTENDTSSPVNTDNDIRDGDIPAPAYEAKYLRHYSNEEEGDNESLFDEEVFESIFTVDGDTDLPLKSRQEDRVHVNCDAFNELKHYIDTQYEGGFDIVTHRISIKRSVEVLRNILFMHLK